MAVTTTEELAPASVSGGPVLCEVRGRADAKETKDSVGFEARCYFSVSALDDVWEELGREREREREGGREEA